MDSELVKMKRYLLHHRIVTYAIILFLILITFILISISQQIENEQALILDSQAAIVQPQGRATSVCPANGLPFRMTYNGASSCYFGQYRSVSVRCTEGARAQIINASALGSFSVCADKTVLEAGAKARCGCTGSGVPSVMPSVGAGTPSPTTYPANPLPSGVQVPSATPFPGVTNIKSGPSLAPKCPRGLKTFTVGVECANQQDVYNNATYICNDGKKGSLFVSGTACKDASYFLAQATAVCKNAASCPRPISITPTSAPFPTTNPND